jgi:phosphohistidine swiveling domain-containing protein
MSAPNETFWTAGYLNERFPAPVSPLGWSVVGPLFEEYALREPLRFMGYPEADRIPATCLVRGHPYANVLIFQIMYNPFPDAFMPVDAVRYFPEGNLNWRRRAPYPRSLLKPRFLISLLSHFLRDPINWTPLNFWQWRRHMRRHSQRVRELNERLDRAVDPLQVLEVIAGANRVHADFLKIHRWSLTYADIFYRWLARLGGESAQTLISDVPSLTQRMNQELSTIAQLAADLSLELDSEQGIAAALAHPEFANALGECLRAHGHRSLSLDIAQPTFRDDPTQFLRLLQGSAGPAFRVESEESLGNATRAHLPLYERPIFTLVLGFARRYASLREDQRYYWHKSLAVSRRAYLMLGESLRAQHVIYSPDDIFYATAGEIAAFFGMQLSGAELLLAIQNRGEAWRQYQAEFIESPARAYPPFMRGDTPLPQTRNVPANVWEGRGVSPGQARGRVRVILDARDLGLVAKGEVLVAPATDPGWTIVFARLSALVTERGGVLAHGAIVARENHLPAVAGIPNITHELADGDWVEVDGTHGLVRRIRGW